MINATNDFVDEVNSVFSLRFLTKKREPIALDTFHFEELPDKRLNHYLIKQDNDNQYHFGEIDTHEMQVFVKKVSDYATDFGISSKERYCFLTLDQGWVEPNQTLRTPGWHIDGMQGDEVETKKPGDLTFIWSNVLPTRFANQGFDVADLNPSIHNVFSWLGKQVDEKNIFESKPYQIYAINPYHVHAGSEATKKVYRIFLRLSYTFTPVTSTKMTINPEIEYNYKYHVTTGEIPSYLK